MKSYISAAGIKRYAIPSSSVAKAHPAPSTAGRRTWSRTLLPAVLVLATVLPFLFVRIAFSALQSSNVSSSNRGCLGWRLLSGNDASSTLTEELTKALLEAREVGSGIHEEIVSFNELVKEMTTKRQDIKTFAFKIKAMFLTMEQNIQSARQDESVYWHLASHGVPGSLHCLSLNLAEEYSVNPEARSLLPPPELFFRLADTSFHHVVLLTDNVLAASVVISSTVQNSANPEKLVFHVVTDKKTYTPMHAWFALNSIASAVVEVKGLHQYDWSQEVNVGVKEMLEIHQLICSRYYNNLKEDIKFDREQKIRVEASRPSCLSLMNHLRIYVPELFPDLDKILLLDDDVVVQHDISSLWDLDLNGNVVGGVVDSWCRSSNYCLGRKFKDYFNFSHPAISSRFDPDRCAWLYGMNIFDLEAWRRTNITATYRRWLKLNLNSGMALWFPGELPPSLIAFEDHVHHIDPSWHVAGLGSGPPEESCRETLEAAAVLHFSGPAKPWLEISFPEVRSFWNKHVNFSNEYVRRCKIMGYEDEVLSL